MEISFDEYLLNLKIAAKKFYALRQDDKFCDVTLCSGDAVIKAHRVVLAANCRYFEEIFTASQNELVNLSDVSPDVLPLVVDFLYAASDIEYRVRPATPSRTDLFDRPKSTWNRFTGACACFSTRVLTYSFLNVFAALTRYGHFFGLDPIQFHRNRFDGGTGIQILGTLSEQLWIVADSVTGRRGYEHATVDESTVQQLMAAADSWGSEIWSTLRSLFEDSSRFVQRVRGAQNGPVSSKIHSDEVHEELRGILNNYSWKGLLKNNPGIPIGYPPHYMTAGTEKNEGVPADQRRRQYICSWGDRGYASG
ncbi:Kelch-like protein 25 [Eumeta japonica]|uniref:Kelch-like protein 25 n=1 Tax=Eumeta variegata TaxID=151549 RepID=A0A4C1ZHQ5_EUMVA|nr:Kelch-like protein 25 [Eumeta japonica]